MKAPNHERAALLAESIRVASAAMHEPIDRISVTFRYVRCWSRAGLVTLSYTYRAGGTTDPISGHFQPGLGSGDWCVQLVDGGLERGIFARLRAYLP